MSRFCGTASASLGAALCVGVAVAVALPSSAVPENRISLAPHFQDGQRFTYRVRHQEDRSVHTESRVVSPMAPENTHTDIVRSLQVVVNQSSVSDARAQTRLRVSLTNPDAPATSAEPPTVEFALSSKGELQDLTNLAAFSPDEQLLWRAWIEQFTVVWALPPSVRIAEKWSTEEPVLGVVLDGLSWRKESRLVSLQSCPNPLPTAESAPAPTSASPQKETRGNSQAMCATVLSRAILKQKSSPKDATPEDYKLHDLKTSGTARGSDEVISYIEITAGIVARGTGDSKQSMDVVVAKTDGSNRVHYTIQAESRTEIVLLR